MATKKKRRSSGTTGRSGSANLSGGSRSPGGGAGRPRSPSATPPRTASTDAGSTTKTGSTSKDGSTATKDRTLTAKDTARPEKDRPKYYAPTKWDQGDSKKAKEQQDRALPFVNDYIARVAELEKKKIPWDVAHAVALDDMPEDYRGFVPQDQWERFDKEISRNAADEAGDLHGQIGLLMKLRAERYGYKIGSGVALDIKYADLAKSEARKNLARQQQIAKVAEAEVDRRRRVGEPEPTDDELLKIWAAARDKVTGTQHGGSKAKAVAGAAADILDKAEGFRLAESGYSNQDSYLAKLPQIVLGGDADSAFQTADIGVTSILKLGGEIKRLVDGIKEYQAGNLTEADLADRILPLAGAVTETCKGLSDTLFGSSAGLIARVATVSSDVVPALGIIGAINKVAQCAESLVETNKIWQAGKELAKKAEEPKVKDLLEPIIAENRLAIAGQGVDISSAFLAMGTYIADLTPAAATGIPALVRLSLSVGGVIKDQGVFQVIHHVRTKGARNAEKKALDFREGAVRDKYRKDIVKSVGALALLAKKRGDQQVLAYLGSLGIGAETVAGSSVTQVQDMMLEALDVEREQLLIPEKIIQTLRTVPDAVLGGRSAVAKFKKEQRIDKVDALLTGREPKGKLSLAFTAYSKSDEAQNLREMDVIDNAGKLLPAVDPRVVNRLLQTEPEWDSAVAHGKAEAARKVEAAEDPRDAVMGPNTIREVASMTIAELEAAIDAPPEHWGNSELKYAGLSLEMRKLLPVSISTAEEAERVAVADKARADS